MKRIFPIFFLLFLIQCAVRKPPSGGPKDTTPPSILNTFPQMDSTRVKNISYVEFQFNENVNRSSVEKAVRCNKIPRNKLNFRWKGSKKLRIYFSDSLSSGATYVFTIGTEAADAHGVHLKKPFVLAFSTDSILYTCSIRGKILNVEPRSVITLGLISLENLSNDSLWYTAPFENITTANEDGTFKLSYIRPGKYRLLAFQDENLNDKFDAYAEKFGLFSRDIFFSYNGDSIAHLNTFLISADTSSPRLKKLEVDKKSIALFLQFNKKVRIQSITIKGTNDSLLIPLYGVKEKSLDQYICYLQNPLLKDTLSLKAIDTDNRIYKEEILYDVSLDSLPTPSFKLDIPNPIYFEDTLKISFSTPIDSALLKKAMQLKQNNKIIPVQFFWNDFKTVQFIPETGKWNIDGKYILTLSTKNLKDFWSQAFKDTVYTYKISVISFDQLGGISGNILSFPDYPAIVLRCRDVTSQRVYSRIIPNIPSGDFEISDLPEGQFILWGFFDQGNKHWDGGQLLPYQAAEPVIFSTDTVRVRARWTKQGILIHE